MKRSGQYAKVTMDIDGTEQDIMELREWSVSASSEKVEADAAGSAWSEHLIGRKSWEGEATCIDADMFWLEFMDDFVTINLFDHEDDPAPAFTGQVSFDFERTTPYDDIIETSLTYTGNGELKSGSTSA